MRQGDQLGPGKTCKRVASARPAPKAPRHNADRFTVTGWTPPRRPWILAPSSRITQVGCVVHATTQPSPKLWKINKNLQFGVNAIKTRQAQTKPKHAWKKTCRMPFSRYQTNPSGDVGLWYCNVAGPLGASSVGVFLGEVCGVRRLQDALEQ